MTSLYWYPIIECICRAILSILQYKLDVYRLMKMARRGQPPRKFFLQRDYTNGTAVRFSDEFPTELRGRVSFHYTMQKYWVLRCGNFGQPGAGFLQSSVEPLNCMYSC